MPPTSYTDYVATQAQSNPCMKGLERYIRQKATHSSKIATIDYAQNGSRKSNNKPTVLENCNIGDIVNQPAANTMRLLLIEDISPQIMIELGEAFDINPIFFAEYVNLNISDVEKGRPSQSPTALPALESNEEHLHHPYQQILDLGSAKLYKDAESALQTDSNIRRDIDILPCLSGRRLGLAHATCSVMVKKFNTYSICLILVDPSVTSAVKAIRAGIRPRYPAKGLQTGFKESELRRSMTSFKNTQASLDGTSMLDDLLHSFQGPISTGDLAATSIISDFCRYPILIVLTHWKLYLCIVDRLSRHYKHLFEETKSQLDNDHLLDLIRWRRQIWQRRRRLTILSESIKSRIQQRCDTMTCQLLLSDITELQDQLQGYDQLFEEMIILATLMMQHLDSRRSILDNVNVFHLTYIAILFAPGFFVSSMFGMSKNLPPTAEELSIDISTTILFLVPAIVLLARYQEVAQVLKDIYLESIRVYKSAYLSSFTQQEMV